MADIEGMKKKTLLTLAFGATLGVLLASCAPSMTSPVAADGYSLAPALSGERRTITLPNFGKVVYYASDEGTGRPLILTHSVNAAASAYEMKPIWDAYKGKRPLYALEWPGFGSSDRPDVRYSRELMTSALLQLVNQLAEQRSGSSFEADVVSLSLGSEFVARAALQESRLRSLVLLSPSGLGKPRNAVQQTAADQKSDASYRNLRLWSDPLYGIIRSRPSIEYFLGLSFRNKVPQGLIDYALLTSQQKGAKFAPLFFLSGHLFTSDAYQELYSRLNTPTLVLYDQDAFVNFERLPLFEKQPNVKALRIENTDGLPHFEQLAKVEAAMNAFWQENK